MTHSNAPDYNALAAEVVSLMAAMRPSQRPVRHDAACKGPFADPCSASPRTDAGAQTASPIAPHPPAIPPDLREIGRGSIGVLEALSRCDEPTTPGHISRLTGLSKGRVSNIIRDLEEKGYVAKGPSPTDNRSVTVVLSAKGKHVSLQHREALQAHVASMLRQLGPKDAQDGVRVMRHLLQIMQANCSVHGIGHCRCPAPGNGQPSPDDAACGPGNHDAPFHSHPGADLPHRATASNESSTPGVGA